MPDRAGQARHHQYERLDSLRGLAALTVGIGHAVLSLNFSPGSPIRMFVLGLFNANYAVDMFFVLSGFVLQNMLTGFTIEHHAAYWLRRLARIYPLLWISLLAGAAAAGFANYFAQAPESSLVFSNWIRDLIILPHTPIQVIRDLIPVDYNLNPVVWTIRIEIEASILYPLLVFAWRRSAGGWKLAILASTLGLSWLIHNELPHYLYMFVVGLALADLRDMRLRVHGARILLCLALGLLLMSGFWLRGHSFTADFVAAMSSALIIYITAYHCPRGLLAFLSLKPLRHLGRLSYAYYLFNAIALWSLVRIATAYGLGQGWSVGDASQILRATLLMMPALVVTLVVSELVHRYVEIPSIVFGRGVQRAVLRRFSEPSLGRASH